MNPEQEQLVRDLVAAGDKATQGPWVNMPNDTPWEGKVVAVVGETVESESLAVIHADDDGDDRPEDREFCAQAANARDAIKALLAERDAMRAVVEAAKEAVACSRDGAMPSLTYCLEDLYAALAALEAK